jgi:Na+-driven multidrug efflux pump
MNFMLIPMWGIMGAAAATSLAYAFNFILKVVIYYAVSRNNFTQLFLFNEFDKRLLAFGVQKARSFFA